MKTSVRVLAFITCLCVLPLLAGSTGCAGARHNIITDQAIQDSRMAERVREALAAGVDYKYAGVKVLAGNGVIQLNGWVNTPPQRTAAAEVASKVEGVKRVENNLTLKD